jgi:hypothetical protein
VSRLRLPDLRHLVPSDGTPPSPAQAVAILLSRRQFLRALGAATVLAALPLTWVERGWAARRGRFFTGAERRTLKALADSILPPDRDAGAVALGAVRYIEGFLTAFEHRVPRIHAGGPFSGREPFIDYARGVPGRRHPRNAFKRFVRPTRLHAVYWRWQLYGSDGLSGADRAMIEALDAQQGGPLPGLRAIYRDGLARLDALSRAQEGAAFAELDPAVRDRVRDAAHAQFPVPPRRDRNFIALVAQHTIEGVLSAPEYGGNRRRRGWSMLGLEGDSQPLGYALYSRRDGDYRERPDLPLSTANPDEAAGPLPLSPEADQVQRFIIATTQPLEDAC